MPFPHVNSEFETLLEPTRIWLFGKPFKSIIYVPEHMEGLAPNDPRADTVDAPGGSDLAPSRALETDRDETKWSSAALRQVNQRRAAQGKAGKLTSDPIDRANEFKKYVVKVDEAGGEAELPMPPKRIERKLRQDKQSFARIYSFSFEGHYYRLPRPLLFLLSGPGQRPDEDRKAAGMFERHVAFSTKLSGTAGEDWQFSANYQELLLQSMIAPRGNASRGDMISRGDVVGRGDGGTAPRAAGAGAFRGDMIGPHQNW